MEAPRAIFVADDQIPRCCWCAGDTEYIRYHDQEWGYPVSEDRHLFEKICLEGFQAGLSWLTILRKRPAFREAFHNFQIDRVARMTDRDVQRLLNNAGIVRHLGKIEATINNARQAEALLHEFGSLASYFWQFAPEDSPPRHLFEEIPAKTQESTAMSRDLKRRGWSFVGPTTCYAFMQSMGLVNDHLRDCHHWPQADRLRKEFERP